MAFNFDQFNNASSIQRELQAHPAETAHIVPSGYVQIKKNDERQIFQKTKMNLNLPAPINFLRVENDWLVVFMSNQLLFRINMKQPEKQSEVFLEKTIAGYKVVKIFLDPTGSHTFLSLVSKTSLNGPKLLYINRNSNKPVFISKMNDHEVTAIGFNLENPSTNSTSNILVGTAKGLIYEIDVACDGDKIIQNNCKQVFDIGRGEITDIGFFRAPGTFNYIVLISTIDRLYKFHEILRGDDKSLQNIFTHYLNVPEEARDYEQQSSKLSYSQLDFVIDNKYPRNFGFLTEAGIMFCEVNQIADNPNFLLNKKTIEFPETPDSNFVTSSYASKSSSIQSPTSFTLTNFHVLIQYADRITGISTINHKVVYDEYFSDDYGKLISLAKDKMNGNIYTFSNKTIFKYRVSKIKN
jgi:hypothetical protein